MILEIKGCDWVFPSTNKVQIPWLSLSVFQRDTLICPGFISLYSPPLNLGSSHCGYYINMDHTVISYLLIPLPDLYFCIECSSFGLYSTCQSCKHTANAAISGSTSSMLQGVLDISTSLLFSIKTLFTLLCCFAENI